MGLSSQPSPSPSDDDHPDGKVANWAVATVDLTRSSGAAPKQMLLWPPGGAWRRVVGRSVMTLPQFWSEPLAKALDDCETGVGMRGAVSASRDC